MVSSAADAATPLTTSWCGVPRVLDEAMQDVSAPSIQAYIARPSDRPLGPEIADELQAAFAGADDLLLAGSGGAKRFRVRTGISGCSPAHVDIVEIVLGPASDYASVAAALGDVDQAVGDTPFVVWAGTVIGLPGAGGITLASSIGQTLPTDPAHDRTVDEGGLALLGSRDPHVLAHEIFHALGAVGSNAQHRDPNHFGHVSDVGDLMYWLSGGSLIDVGNDDYFNPSGVIVGRDGLPIWNVFDSLFLCAPEKCSDGVTRPTVTLQGTAIDASTARFTAMGADYYRWYIDGQPHADLGGPVIDGHGVDSVSASVRGFSADGVMSDVATASVQLAHAPGDAGDSDDRSSGTDGGLLSDNTAPVLSNLKVSPQRPRLSFLKSLTNKPTKSRPEIRFDLSERATVILRITRRTSGRRVGGRCRRQIESNRGRGSCARYVAVGTLRPRMLTAGSHRVAFRGGVLRTLTFGRHRIVARPVDTAGNLGSSRRTSFTIVGR